MKDFRSRAFALNLTAAIHKMMDDTAIIGTGTPHTKWQDALRYPEACYRAEGIRALRTHQEDGQVSVPVRILVLPNWVERPPTAFCFADFIRHETDWHVQVDGSLCHVLPHEWAWQIDQWWQQGIEMEQIVDRASAWCWQNVDSLITRHLLGHRIGLTKWPKQWGQWSHYQQGIDEFYRSRAQIQKAA